MKINDLKPRQQDVDIEVEVEEKGEERTFNKYGREMRVSNAVVKDDSGSIKLTLWNNDVDKVNVGDKVKITKGYVNEFQGEKQLTAGKFGKLEIVDGEGGGGEDDKEKGSEED